MAKPGETTLDEAVRKLKDINQNISADPDAPDADYKIILAQDGAGKIAFGDELVRFESTHQLLEFLRAPFQVQVRMIHNGKVG